LRPGLPLDAARNAVIVMQAQAIALLAAENTRLAGQVADLSARVERLERLASRNGGGTAGRRDGGNGDLRAELAGVVCVPDRRPRHPGAPVRGLGYEAPRAPSGPLNGRARR
jgi:hypothetical protein